MMKMWGAAALMVAMLAPAAWSEELVNKKEFTAAAEKAGELKFSMSLAQTAQLLDFCGKKDKAQEVRDYLQPVTMVITAQSFEGVEGSEASKQNMRGMFLSRAITAAITTELATRALLRDMQPTDEQKTKLCALADSGYAKVVEMKSKDKVKQ